MKLKIDAIKAASIAGTVLGIAGTLISSWVGEKQTKETIAKEVEKALASKNQ